MRKNYTAHHDDRINTFVESHLTEITKQIRNLMADDVLAIILSGGFGRGEGSIIERDDGSLHVVNDYDIDIIYKEKFNKLLSKIFTHLRYRKKINHIAIDLARHFDIKQIDLNLKTANDLHPESNPKLADYDLAYGHVVLFEKNIIFKKVPKYESSQIPIFEGTWLLRNRGIGLLLASFYISGNTIAAEKTEYFYIEINKAILAMGDALFILKGKYVCSYAERSRQFDELCDEHVPNHEFLIQLYKDASHYKLFPCKDMHTTYNCVELYNMVCELYCEFFLYYETNRLERPVTSIHEYNETVSEGRIKNRLKYKLRYLFEKLLGKTEAAPENYIYLKLDRGRSVATTFTLLFHTSNRLDDRELMSNMTALVGNRTIYKYSPIELKRLFLLLIHPKGELGRVLGK